MRTRISRSIRLTAGIFFLTATLAATTSAAQGFANGEAWHVNPGNNTNTVEHDNAVYMVFLTNPAPSKQYGIFFMQTQGAYAFKPFICGGGIWSPSEQSVSCATEGPIVATGQYLKETIEIGRLAGNFCHDLRETYRKPSGETPIKDEDGCRAPGKCSCYEVRQECRNDASEPWDPDKCPELGSVFGSAEGAIRGSDTGRAPPSKGAGSGTSN